MCGIAGIINKQGMEISTKLLEMLSLIQHRGMDATGIAVYYQKDDSLIDLRVAETKKDMHSTLLKVLGQYSSVLEEKSYVKNLLVSFTEARLKMAEEDLPQLHAAINRIDGLYVHSLGRGIKVYKDGGTTKDLLAVHQIGQSIATHGMGHVRLATESAEDINAAHPFVSPFYPQLSIVHNGQFTNYFNVRRYLESKGAIFKTMNDSEAASHLIAYAMANNGGDLESALSFALNELDGIFCIMASTDNQFGFVKDKLGIKPLLVFETEDIIMFGSEQIEFTALHPDVFAEEMEPGEMRVWSI